MLNFFSRYTANLINPRVARCLLYCFTGSLIVRNYSLDRTCRNIRLFSDLIPCESNIEFRASLAERGKLCKDAKKIKKCERNKARDRSFYINIFP